MNENYKNIFSLENKLAFVVGGDGLIGKEIVKACLENEAEVVTLDYKKKISTNNPRFHYEVFDCADLNNIESNLQKYVNKYGSPDILINCSYPRTINWSKSSFESVNLNTLRKNVDIHMNSFSWIAKIICDEMVKSNTRGSVIQFGSIYGILGQDLSVYEGTKMKENMIYSLIKGGVINLSRQMASYYGQYYIRINSICPGGIRGHVAGKSDSQDPVFIRQYSKKTPLKRMGNPQDIAPLTVFLASDASSYITGQSILVDGGWSII